MIRTSYYAKYHGCDGVSIARIKPAWFDGGEYKALAPEAKTLFDYKKDLDKEKYTVRYISQLNKLDVHSVYKDLDGKVLLCYEKTGSFCHRNIVSKWFRDNGYDVKEL